MMLLPGELQVSEADFITTEAFFNRNMRVFGESDRESMQI